LKNENEKMKMNNNSADLSATSANSVEVASERATPELKQDSIVATSNVSQSSKTPKDNYAGDIVVPINWKTSIIFTVLLGLACLFVLFSTDAQARFSFIGLNETALIQIPNVNLPAQITIMVLTVAMAIVTALSYYKAIQRQKMNIAFSILFGFSWVFAFLIWQIQGKETDFYVTGLLSMTMALSAPLIFGAMCGMVCEHVGVINIAIEGQLLFGAFSAVLSGSVIKIATGNDGLALLGGVIMAPISGVLLGLLLAVFSVKYFVNQMIVGVLINVLATGLTAYFYSTIMTENLALNSAMKLPVVRIPILADIPIIGPVLFDQSVLIYIMYILVIGLQYMLFHSRWGLRMRACGEHPKAADTLGVNVNRTRFRNVLLGSAIAGLGGAYFTIAQGLVFGEGMSSGKGFIALAAMIMGGWKPLNALAVACLFGFTDAVQILLTTFGASIPSQFLLMMPYIVTVFAIAGVIGKVTPPAQEGRPYVG
jgi:simple sugar transport system permease protein